jgi:hypothetical protein
VKVKTLFLLFSTALLISGCKDSFTFNAAEKDEIVVKIEDKVLFKSQLSNLIHSNATLKDSLSIVNGFIENWIRDNLMIIEAEKNVPAGMDLNKLIADYRASLLVYNLEKRLIEEQLDTIVTENQRMDYYENNKNQFILSHNIYKAVVAVFPKNYAGLKDIQNLLAKDEISEALALISSKAVSFKADINKWYTLEDLSSGLPVQLVRKQKMDKGSLVRLQQNGLEYFIRILDKYNENQIPPLEYIEEKVVKVILNNRKSSLIKNMRQNLYDKAIANNKIKIYN